MTRSSRGFSLVELMVAMVVSLVVILGAGQLFISLSQTSQRIAELSDKQAAISFASNELMREVRRSNSPEDIYTLSDSSDGVGCTLYYREPGQTQSQPLLDGFSTGDDEMLCEDFDLFQEIGVSGLQRVRFYLVGQDQPFEFYVQSRQAAVGGVGDGQPKERLDETEDNKNEGGEEFVGGHEDESAHDEGGSQAADSSGDGECSSILSWVPILGWVVDRIVCP